MTAYRDNAFDAHGTRWRVTWCGRVKWDGAWLCASVYKTFDTRAAADAYAECVRAIPFLGPLSGDGVVRPWPTDPRVEEDAHACSIHPLAPPFGLHINLGAVNP